MTSKSTEPRKGMPSPQLSEAEFKRRFRSPYADPACHLQGRLFACVVHGDVEAPTAYGGS